jgi:hypothetical protein
MLGQEGKDAFLEFNPRLRHTPLWFEFDHFEGVEPIGLLLIAVACHLLAPL